MSSPGQHYSTLMPPRSGPSPASISCFHRPRALTRMAAHKPHFSQIAPPYQLNLPSPPLSSFTEEKRKRKLIGFGICIMASWALNDCDCVSSCFSAAAFISHFCRMQNESAYLEQFSLLARAKRPPSLVPEWRWEERSGCLSTSVLQKCFQVDDLCWRTVEGSRQANVILNTRNRGSGASTPQGKPKHRRRKRR